MNQLACVVRAKLRMALHQLRGVRHESKLKIAVISVSALFLWLGAFLLFYGGFEYLPRMGLGPQDGEFDLAKLLMGRLLSILALSVFLLLIFSNVLVAFSTLYRAKEVYFLLQAPITYEQFFHARFFECLAFSSWSLAFLGSPLMLAFGLSTGAGPGFYIAILIYFIPFIVIPACLGSVMAIVLVRIFPRLRMPAILVLSAAALLLFSFQIASAMREARAEEDALLPALLDATARTQSPLLPSYWAAQGVLEAAEFDLRRSGYHFALLLSTAMMGMLLAGKAAQWLFFPGWSFLLGQDRQRLRPPDRGVLNRVEPCLRWLPEPARALIVKDVKLFWRDPVQWSQFIIFFGIMAVYIANLRNTSRAYDRELWRAWVACLNAGALTLILSTLTSRFVFPLISLEGKRFWILGLAPLQYRQLLWQKFWLSVGATSLFTVSLSVLSAIMLKLDATYFALTVYSVALCNFGLAGLAVGLGTLYPTFTEDNPARIVSGLGGTLNLLLSVGYIAVVVGIQTVVLQWPRLHALPAQNQSWLLGGGVLAITLLTAVCVLLPMRLGLRHLERMEF